MSLALALQPSASPVDADEGVRTDTAISVVIPAKNEERNIAWVLHRIPTYVDEVILVDGNSTDRTVEVALAVRPDIRVLRESARGKGSALRTGFAAATGDVVVMLDADGSMDPADIATYVEALAAGADLVKGSRFLPGGGTSDMTAVRRLGNRALLAMVNILYRARFTELCYGYMAIRRSGVQMLQLTASGFEIETEIVVRSLRAGLCVVEVPSYEAERRYGASNLNATRDGIRVFRTLLGQRVRRTNTLPAAPAPVPSPVGIGFGPSLRLVPIAPSRLSASTEVEALPLELHVQTGTIHSHEGVPTA